MTTTLKARFDGKVLVPIGPVDLPKDRELEIEVKESAQPGIGSPELLLEIMKSLPPIDPETMAEFDQALREAEQPPSDKGAFDDLR